MNKTSLLSCLLLGMCATDVTTCDWVKPIYPSREDVLTRGTKQQITIHNETWEQNK